MATLIVNSYWYVIMLVGAAGHYNPHMDSVYYAIDWVGSDDSLQPVDINLPADESSSSVTVTTSNQEKYRCKLPRDSDSSGREKEVDEDAVDTFELELLKPLFEQTACTYRLETYWTYELCHGKHLRQYHEEKEIGKKTRLTEYFLGRYKTSTFMKEYAYAKDEHANRKIDKKSSKSKKVQGIEIPYYEAQYEDGTVCDLTGQPRRASIQFVCQSDGRGEIYELKETSSCEYEVVVLTALLCPHTAYGPKKERINTIQCQSLGNSPRRPINFNLPVDSPERYNSKEDDVDVDDDDASTNPPLKPTVKPPVQSEDRKITSQIGEHTDKQMLRDFLAGDFCIRGGTGWWQYEYCYGRHVLQYHEEKSSKVIIMLGEWDTAAHLLWIANNPRKRPPPVAQRKAMRHFYGNGDFCEASGKNRISEVKLRCLDNPSLQHSMSIYVLEPRPCEYQVVVESRLLCPIIQQADDNGLVLDPKI